MLAPSPNLVKTALIQFCSGASVANNTSRLTPLIRTAAKEGAKFICLPECVDYIRSGHSIPVPFQQKVEDQQDLLNQMRKICKEESVWLNFTYHHHISSEADSIPFNRSVLIDCGGRTQSQYDKLHMFDLASAGLFESQYIRKGSIISAPFETPIGKVGLAICYDLRFPVMHTALRNAGAEVILFPSAFTVPTGAAHWEALLRSVAIQNQCYVLAAAQSGVSEGSGRKHWGHSMIIGPYGDILAQASENTSNGQIIYNNVDIHEVRQVRNAMPLSSHQRQSETYGLANLADIYDAV